MLNTILLTIIGKFVAGRQAGLSHKSSTNIGLTIVSRGEFLIIIANIGIVGGLLSVLKTFLALYVLSLSIIKGFAVITYRK